GVVHGNPAWIGQRRHAEWERNRQLLVENLPVANIPDITRRRAHHVLADGNQIYTRRVEQSQIVIVGKPDSHAPNLGHEMGRIVVVVTSAGGPAKEVLSEIDRG